MSQPIHHEMLTIVHVQIILDELLQFDHLVLQELLVVALEHDLGEYVLFSLFAL